MLCQMHATPNPNANLLKTLCILPKHKWIEPDTSPDDELNILHSYVASGVSTEQCDLGIYDS